MPQINFAEALSAESPQAALQPKLAPMGEFYSAPEFPVSAEAARFRSTRLGRPEWANILFAGIAIFGGLFSAFYFFNGVELFRSALSFPREFLYPRPLTALRNPEVASSGLPDEVSLSGQNPGARSLRTDPRGDPFSRTSGLITLDRPLSGFVRGGSFPGAVPPPLPPSIPGSPVPPGIPVPPVIGPGPAGLISQLALLIPGADRFTQSLRNAAREVPKDIVVTLRHEAPRVRTIVKRVVKTVIVRRTVVASKNGPGTVANKNTGMAQGLTGASSQQIGSSGVGVSGSALDRMNSGTGAISIGAGAGGLAGTAGGTIGGALGGLGGGLHGTVGGALGGIGGGLGGKGGGLLGGGGGRH